MKPSSISRLHAVLTVLWLAMTAAAAMASAQAAPEDDAPPPSRPSMVPT